MKKSDKTIAVSIAVLVVVGIGIYYFVSKNNSNAVPNIPASTTQPPATPAPTAPVSNTPTTPASASITVSIKNVSFNPSTLTVKAGTKVTWINNDSVPHTVTSDSGNLLNSPTLSPGQSFSFIFTTPGTTNYHCNIHPMMRGIVVVQN